MMLRLLGYFPRVIDPPFEDGALVMLNEAGRYEYFAKGN